MTGNYEKFSVEVIIPVKNGEKYIRDSINSVLAQTHKNIRVTVVDDGSTDETAKICDEYAEKYENFRVFHTENRGVSAARNYGIEHAEGDYIAFLDADDYAVSYCYETLLRNALENDCEISACGYERVKTRNFTERVKAEERTILLTDTNTSLENMINSHNSIEGYVWNKIYKRSAVKDIRFGDYKFCEDCIFSWDAVCSVKKICFTPEKLIYYFVSYKIYKPTEDGVKVYEEMIRRAERLGLTNVKNQLMSGKLYHILWLARNLALFKGDINISVTKERVRQLLYEIDVKSLQLSKLTKLRLFFINHNWLLYRFMEKTLYILKKR